MCVCLRIIQSESLPRTGDKCFLWCLPWLWWSRIVADHICFLPLPLHYVVVRALAHNRVQDSWDNTYNIRCDYCRWCGGIMWYNAVNKLLEPPSPGIRTALASSKSISDRWPTHDRVAYVQIWKWATLPMCTMNRRNPLCPDLILGCRRNFQPAR